MSYKVDRFNGTFLVNVSDGSIDTTTDLRFIGKNYAGYGEIQNENFLHLMENFANTSPPPKAQIGQIWYDSTATVKKLKFWDGSQWKVASGAVPQSTPPAGLTAGEFWFNTVTGQVSVWSGSEFVLIGPENTSDIESTTVIPDTVNDENNVNHLILRVNILGNTVMVFSNTEFVIKPNTYQWAQGNRFTRIKKGSTLAFTDNSGITTNDFNLWGTASVAKGILGPNNTFLSFTELVLQAQRDRFTDNGLFLGVTNINNSQENGKVRIFIENGNIPVFENINFTDTNNSLVFRLRTDGVGSKVSPLIVSRNSVFPESLGTIDLGRSNNTWNQVYANNYNGNLTGNVTGNTTGVHKGNVIDLTDTVRFNAASGEFNGTFNGTFNGAFIGDLNGTATSAATVAGLNSSETSDPNSIPIRTANGNLVANRFIGIADNADRLLVGSVYRVASTGQVGDTIAARDVNADITARIFNGTATSAQYADLAEKYLPDAEYDAGTVVVVGGEKEITASSEGERAIGVISTNPAFMMNKDLDGGIYVALKGRVPVKVVGPVKKGQRLIADNNGYAVVNESYGNSNVFAVALETNLDHGAKLIEAIVL
jgi:hypothetical protein